MAPQAKICYLFITLTRYCMKIDIKILWDTSFLRVGKWDSRVGNAQLCPLVATGLRTTRPILIDSTSNRNRISAQATFEDNDNRFTWFKSYGPNRYYKRIKEKFSAIQIVHRPWIINFGLILHLCVRVVYRL